MQIPVLALTAVSSLGFMAGGLMLKRFADSGAASDLIASLTIYFLSNVIFARVLAHGLAQGMVISSMIQLVTMSLAGAFFFGEKFGDRHLLGLILALVVVWLFSVTPKSST